MHDDFSALDLLSIGGFRLSPAPLPPTDNDKRRFVGRHRRPTAHAKRGLADFLPLFKGKGKRARPSHVRALRGWPVSLSWPTKEFTLPDLSVDLPERPAS